ncbi:MAG TPA: OmpH family outer membrane protein [Sphingobacteriaceae bacterium]|nr:OmpH family outer membrane protein [Sphingobacteriaceae bacterium]
MKHLIKVAVVALGVVFAGNAANAQQKFAHINSSDLLQSMPEMKSADAAFQVFAKAKQTQLEKMDAERQKKITVYTEKSKTLSEANKDAVGKEIEMLVKEIQDMEKRIGETQSKAEQEVATKRQELYKPAIDKAETAVRAVAKEKGYAYVFDISQPGVVYFDGGEDMMGAVRAKLGISTTASTAPKK